MDAELTAGHVRGALHGIPILIKDNIDTHDRMQTTSGSLALEGNYASRDAFIVRKLRESGAVILGKTNLSEWANFRGKPSISGWSSRGGLTLNPHALDRSACGSSSGSAVAVAANLCVAAIGTETDGSIICPSQSNGIVGLKPTVGLWSRTGIIPISHSQDSPGPMARNVEDAAILLSALAGTDTADPASRKQRSARQTDYYTRLSKDGLKGARIGIARNMAGANPSILEIFESSIEIIKECGAQVIDPSNVPNFNKFSGSEVEVLLFEFKSDLNKYLGSLPSDLPHRSLADIISFNETNKARVMPYFGQERMIAAQKKGTLSSAKYKEALRKNRKLSRTEGLDKVFRKYKLDAIIVPSGGPVWPIDLVNGDAINWDMESTSPPAVAGYPHITVPAGFVFGLPVGLSFIGKAWQDTKLLQFAYAFEQASLIRKHPRYLKTIEVAPTA
jgi:amidase